MMNEGEKYAMLRAVFDAMPSLIFVVDKDVRIQDFNTDASDLLKSDRKTVLKQRAGDILHCIHAGETAEGCGNAPFCKNCIIRNSVTEAFRGSHVVRRRTRIEFIQERDRMEMYALITASPFAFHNESRVLLVIEDIGEIAELHRMIPICSVCGKLRDDTESWKRVETYFKAHWDVDFSHGFCPECYKKEMDKISDYCKPDKI